MKVFSLTVFRDSSVLLQYSIVCIHVSVSSCFCGLKCFKIICFNWQDVKMVNFHSKIV